MTRLGAGREFDLIRSFLAQARSAAGDRLDVGPGDDCAVLDGYALSCDLSVEDVHFRRAWLAPREIGYRATTAAFSDLAAVAARPLAALVSFAFTSADADGWAQDVMAGVHEALDAYDAALAGGDTTRSLAGALIDIVAIGETAAPALRSHARIGDEVWVTGTLGGAAAAVAAWLAGSTPAPAARARYARPVARTAEALWLRDRIHALIDLSDGIAGDAGHLAAASGCRIRIDAARLPVHPEAGLMQALRGGEDYELCMTAAPGALAAVQAEFEERFGIPITPVGDVVQGVGVVIDGAAAEAGFDHFAGQPPA